MIVEMMNMYSQTTKIVVTLLLDNGWAKTQYNGNLADTMHCVENFIGAFGHL